VEDDDIICDNIVNTRHHLHLDGKIHENEVPKESSKTIRQINEEIAHYIVHTRHRKCSPFESGTASASKTPIHY